MRIKDVKAEINFVDSFVKKLDIETTRPPGNNQDVDVNMSIDYTISDIEVIDEKLYSEVDLLIKTELSDQEGIYTQCTLIYAGLFNAEIESIPKDKFGQMLEVNGIMILYQLSRSLITSVTAQSGITPPITLPLINIYKVIENKKSANRDKGNDEVEKQ